MSTNVIMPVLGMVQETAKIVRWLKATGDTIKEGEILIEVETDKAVQELEAPATGIVELLAKEGDNVPVTHVVAVIMSPDEYAATLHQEQSPSPKPSGTSPIPVGAPSTVKESVEVPIAASPLAARIASENGIQLAWIKPQGGRIEKADVLAYIEQHSAPQVDGRILASPKARRLALENRRDLATLIGSGPSGAVLARDIQLAGEEPPKVSVPALAPPPGVAGPQATASQPIVTSTVWRRMAEHTANSWAAAPHFYLHRAVRAARLLAWHAHMHQDAQYKITITDLLVMVTARTLAKHPRINVIWQDGEVKALPEIGISLAVAIEEGLVVPVIHHADRLSPLEIARERKELMDRAQNGKLRVPDISGGSFTISNLGMYGVDAFDAVLNGPQAAILAVGRITEQVVPVNGVPGIEPMLNLSISFDHRAIDGATGAKFLADLAEMLEEPLLLVS